MVAALALIFLILLQHGKGADAGAAFGSGASSTVFGSRGSGSFLTRSTAILATAFFATSLFMGYLTISRDKATPIIPAAEPAALQAPTKPLADDNPAGDLPPVEAPQAESAGEAPQAGDAPVADAAPAFELESKGGVETQPTGQTGEPDLKKIPD